MGEVEIIEKDITDLLGSEVTICILQLKSPFDDECASRLAGGNNILTWNPNELQKRKEKILALLDLVKKYREDVNIIVLPEYSIHYEMMENLQNFANSKRVILIGSYYDDRNFIEQKENKDFRKNICSVILPNRTPEKVVKLNKTSFEGDFLEEPGDDEKRILRFYWQVNDHKLYLQIFICSDFLDNLEKTEIEHGGIIIVPACSPEIEEFEGISKWCIRPHRGSKVVRSVFVCNAVSLPEQQTKLSMIGNSQIFGPYRGSLPVLGTDVEGGIIASVIGQNIITKPSGIPSKFNIVIENPINFCLQEKNGNWKIEETKPFFKREKWVINPNIFPSLGLNTYLTFAKLKSYYSFRPVLKESVTKCFGIMGADDLVAISLAEEESDALMFLYPGMSDLASSLGTQDPMPSYFKVTDYYKYKGYGLLPSVSIGKEVIEDYKEYLYLLGEGLNVEKIDEDTLDELKEKKLILGEEENVFNIEEVRVHKVGEFLVGVFLPARGILAVDPCGIFDKECVHKHLMGNPNVTDILFSDTGAGGRRAINLHYIIRVIGDIWSIRNLILNSIHKPLSEKKIEFGTRIMPIIDYLSDLEYEALLETHTHDPAKRRVLREIINKAEYRLGKEALLLRRLPLIDIDKLLTIYEFRNRAREVLGLHEGDVIDKIVKFFSGWILVKVKQPKDDTYLNRVYNDTKDFYTALAEKVEGILSINLTEKRDQIGKEEFDEAVSKVAKKQITITQELNPLIIATSIWNNNYKDELIMSEDYTSYVKNLQANNVGNIRNHFSHYQESHSGFLRNLQYIKNDMDKIVDALLSMMEFLDKFAVER